MLDLDEPSVVARPQVLGVPARRPLAVFFAVTFGVGWPLLTVPALAFHDLIPGGDLPVELFALAVTLLVMLPAALWVTWASDGREAVRHLLGRALRWRFGVLWWVVVILAIPGTTLALGLAAGGTMHTADLASITLHGVVSAVTALLVIHLWEETVWTGFVQTRLECRHSMLVAAILTAAPFAAIHLPLLLVGDVGLRSLLADMAGLACLAMAMRLMAGVFSRATAQSVLAIATLHTVFNASNNDGGPIDGLLDGADQNVVAVIAMVLVTAAVAAAVGTRRRRRLASPPLVELGGCVDSRGVGHE